MLRNRMHLVFVALASTLAVSVSAQCVRPTPPPGGLPVTHTLSVPVVYSDGYSSNASLLLPDGPAPSCGWPLVVYVHWLGGTRFEELPLQLLIAGQGYAVWSYDVRGQGETVLANAGHPNGGSTLWGPIERHDLAEQVDYVANELTWQGIIDPTRLGVIGSSQGGGHAWAAAALSGELLTTPGRTSMTFPIVRCVLPRDLVANPTDDWLRHGELFSSWWVEAITGSYAALPLDPTLVQDARTAFITQDPASLQAAWLAEGRDLAGRLGVTTVPVFYSHAYFDTVSGPMSALRQLELMPGSVRSMLGTLGHGVPSNDLERAANENLTLRWLHRYLWDDANEVELEPPHRLSMLPLDATERDDPSFAWNRTTAHDLTPATLADRFYLHDGFEMSLSLPTGPQSAAAIVQAIDPQATSFNPADYFDQPSVRTIANVLAACPLDEKVWVMILQEDQQLLRSPAVHLKIVPDAASWMLAVSLTVEPIGGDEVLLASDVIASRNSVVGIVEQHDLRLPPISAHLPAGATIRLRLRNLWLDEFPMQQRLAVAPLFTDFGLDILMGAPPASSWLELPLQPLSAKLIVDRRAIDLTTAPQVTATIRGGAAHSGDPYFVAVGISGIVPATSYLGEVVPLDGDWLTVASAGSSAVYYTGFLGMLDGNGETSCALDYSSVAPLPQILNGYQLTMAAFIWDYAWAPTGESTNACEIMLR